MKNSFLILLLLLLTKISFAQDTTKIIYTQETDTLVKQRFIDRYENVFMTKVPTRHMLKVGLSQYFQPLQFTLLNDKAFNNSSLSLGYEFKFLPAFSIALSSHIPFYITQLPEKYVLRNMVADVQLRWFFDMKKRIRSGKSANNFSGNYVALNYTSVGVVDLSENGPTLGLKLGFQRRFLNSGFLDFAISLQQKDPTFHYGLISQWAFSTQATFGFAFGDWKKAKKAPLCDLLLCDADLRQQWKVKLPELTFVHHINKIRLGFGYERKLGESPFSVNAQYDVFLNRGYNYTSYYSSYYQIFEKYAMDNTKEISQTISLQPRYYLFQKRNQLLGKGSNGFSGIYAGINSEYDFYFGKHNVYNTTNIGLDIKRHIIKVGPLFGFQQRLFSHGYLDLNASVNYQNRSLQPNSNTRVDVKANLGIGFAF